MDELKEIGVTGNPATAELFPELPIIPKGWNATNTLIKLEATNKPNIDNGLGVVNAGLGKGEALKLFNENIVKFGSLGTNK